jgi:uncharacterized protein (DUF58 family)
MFGRCRFAIPNTTWAYLAILAVIVIGAIMREINLLIILAGLMAGPLLMSWQLIRLTLRDLTVTRQVPRGVFPGQPFVVEFTVHNRRKRLDSWALVIEDRLRNLLAGHQGGVRTARCLVPHVVAGKAAGASFRAQLWDRGRYRFGPLRLSTSVPVGLLTGRVTLKETTDLLVYPKLGRLQRGWAELVKHEQLGHRSSRRHQGSVEGDFYGLRDWRPGDSRRWIHWRSSAKRQEPVVRQFEQQRSQDLFVVLDLSLDSNEQPESDQRALQIERAISFVATLAAAHCRRGGGRMALGVAGQSARLLRGTASSALLEDALEVLAEAAATSQDPLPELLPELLAGTSPGDRLIIVAARATDPLDPRRFPVALRQGRHHAHLQHSICVDVRQPQFADLFCWDDDVDVEQPEVV